MPLEDDLLLIQHLTASGTLSTEQSAEVMGAAYGGGGEAAPALLELLVVKGIVSREFADGWRAAGTNAEIAAREPKDLEKYLLLDSALSASDFARVRRIRTDTRKSTPERVPSVAQVVLSLGLLQREAIEKYLEDPAAVARAAAAATATPEPAKVGGVVVPAASAADVASLDLAPVAPPPPPIAEAEVPDYARMFAKLAAPEVPPPGAPGAVEKTGVRRTKSPTGGRAAAPPGPTEKTGIRRTKSPTGAATASPAPVEKTGVRRGKSPTAVPPAAAPAAAAAEGPAAEVKPRVPARLTPIAIVPGGDLPALTLEPNFAPPTDVVPARFADGMPVADGQDLGECGICRSKIASGAITRACDTCGAVYHRECWSPVNGCPQATCKRLRASIDERVLHSGPSAAVAWMKHYARLILLICAGVVAIAYSSTFFVHDARWYHRRAVEARAGAFVGQKVARALDPTRGMAVDESQEQSPITEDVRKRIGKQVEYLRKALALDPTLMAAWNDLGIAGVDLGDDALAREGYEAVARLDPANGLVRLALGVLEERRDEFDTAERWYHEAVVLSPQDPDAWRRYGRLLDARRPKQLAEAVDAYARVLAIVPDDHETTARKALAEARLLGPGKAIPALEAVLAAHPDRSDVELSLARAYLDVGRFADAVRLAGNVSAADSSDLDARLLWAVALARDGRPQETVVALESVATPEQTRGEVFRRLAEAQAELWQLDPALENARRAAELERVPAAHLSRARILTQAGRHAEALALLEPLGRDLPEAAAVDLLRVEVLLELGAPDRAAEILARMSAGPERERLGLRLLRKEGKGEPSEALARELLARGAPDGALWIEAGYVALEAGFVARAVDRFRAAVAAGVPDGHLGLARAWRQAGEPLRAAGACAAFLERIPAGPQAAEARAWLAETFPRLSPTQLLTLGRVQAAHLRLGVAPRGRKRALQRTGALLLELRLLVQLLNPETPPADADLHRLEQFAAVAAREESDAAAPAEVVRESDLVAAFEVWMEELRGAFGALCRVPSGSGDKSPFARESERILGALSDEGTPLDRLERHWAAGLAVARPWAISLKEPAPAVRVLDALEARRPFEESLAVGPASRQARSASAFADGLLGLLEASGARGDAACAARLRLRWRMAETSARDAVEQTWAAVRTLCETLFVLGGIQDNGW